MVEERDEKSFWNFICRSPFVVPSTHRKGHLRGWGSCCYMLLLLLLRWRRQSPTFQLHSICTHRYACFTMEDVCLLHLQIYYWVAEIYVRQRHNQSYLLEERTNERRSLCSDDDNIVVVLHVLLSYCTTQPASQDIWFDFQVTCLSHCPRHFTFRFCFAGCGCLFLLPAHIVIKGPVIVVQLNLQYAGQELVCWVKHYCGVIGLKKYIKFCSKNKEKQFWGYVYYFWG